MPYTEDKISDTTVETMPLEDLVRILEARIIALEFRVSCLQSL